MQKGNQQKKTSSSKLEDQAAAAALYVTKSQRKSVTESASEETWLDSNNKLSSAGAAASLKYAMPKDLPSYPSSGLPTTHSSSAGAAASQGWANQKTFEHWKPDPSSAASTAALMANDYKTNPAWKPQQTTNGTKAALLAHRDATKIEVWKSESSGWSNSAALLAVQGQKKNTPILKQVDNTRIGRQGSLLAATGAMSGSRRRAQSTPIRLPDTYPDQSNAVANARSAATVAHKPSMLAKFNTSGTNTSITNMPRAMYTSKPPVAPEVEEKERSDMLRASAVAMAQRMYTIQQKQIDAAAQDLGVQAAASASAPRRAPISAKSEQTAAPMQFNNLQEAAQKLAQKRLSSMDNEHSQAREYREYYGDSKSNSSSVKRLSMGMPSARGRPRQRASSLGAEDDDKEQSEMIRAKMSMFSNSLSKVDAKKRQEDREALIAIAQRNVTKSLHGMDERVFQDTGKASPSLLNEWEAKAQATAQAKSDERMLNHGKVNIGGGKYVEQSDVDLAAARNVQPALDDINEKAAAERARQAEAKADEEANKRTEESKKQREKEEKEVQKKLKQQDKNEAKAAKEEEKRLAKEEKRKSGRRSWILPKLQTKESASSATEDPTTSSTVDDTTAATPAVGETAVSSAVDESNTDRFALDTEELQPSVIEAEPAQEVEKAAAKTSPTSASPKSGGRVKSWFKTAFASAPHSRRSSKNQKEGFIGGAALTGANGSQNSINANRTEEPAVGTSAEVGGTKDEDRIGRSKKRNDSVSSMEDEKEEFEEARDNFDEGTLSPPKVVRNVASSQSPARETKFHEDIS